MSEKPHTILFDSEHANSFTMGLITGVVVSAIKDRVNEKEIGKESVKDYLKVGLQSGIVACSINDAKNKMERGHYGKATLSLALGTAGVYITEQLSNSLDINSQDIIKIDKLILMV
jgi:hypothetical protein